MTRTETLDLAYRLMNQWLPSGNWGFKIGKAKKRLGRCNYRTKMIEVSQWHIEQHSDAEVRDTILHEIAHAIAGGAAKHGPEWMAVCKLVGAKPQRLADEGLVNRKYRWIAPCTCGNVHGMHRKPKRRYFCRISGNTLQYTLAT